MFQRIQNKIMLITYADCMGNDLKDLKYILEHYIGESVKGLHILPFFPSSGDRGFAPITYKEVSPEFGNWSDITELGEKYYLMYDYMVNHISIRSDIYQDFLKKKDESEYHDFFIRYKDFWENGDPTPEEEAAIYRRRDKGQYIVAHFADNTSEKVWCTFGDEQVDINCAKSKKAKEFLTDNLNFLAKHGAALIRLDAFAYTTKKAGTNCFFIEPDVWEIMEECRDILKPFGIEILPEIHENYFIQKKLEEKGYYVYDFQLPMLLLNAIYFGKSIYIKNWLRICSRKQFTTLDTHDGIGVVDVRYLMPDDEAIATKMKVFEINPEAEKMVTRIRGPVKAEFDTYQINCTYYSAVGEDDDKYFLSRAVQFFAPGIPQVYYVGMLAGRNDFELASKTQVPRDMNRHYYTVEEVRKEMERPVVAKLHRLMRFRNTHAAFDGHFFLLDSNDISLHIRWENGDEFAELQTDFEKTSCYIYYSEQGQRKLFE